MAVSRCYQPKRPMAVRHPAATRPTSSSSTTPNLTVLRRASASPSSGLPHGNLSSSPLPLGLLPGMLRAATLGGVAAGRVTRCRLVVVESFYKRQVSLV